MDDACGDDRELRAEVDRLLRHDLTEIPPTNPHNVSSEPTDPNIGRRIGPYEIKDKLGAGGFGDVYRAVRRDDFKQYVAIKIIKRGKDTQEVLKRFHQERKFLAALQHDHIARFITAGETDDGLPYFVMEYVKGKPNDKYCDEHKLGTVARLKLFQQVCAAVQFAHSKFVLHRDLKPGVSAHHNHY